MTLTPDRRISSLRFGLAGSVALVLLLSGCGDDESKKKPLTQVAAKVDGEEISIHQVNSIMSREGMPAQGTPEISQQILERLIDQQVLVNRAIEAKLDRDPNVLLKIDMARREILGQAYLEKQLTGLSKPTAGDIRKYYVDNPYLFSDRKIYDVQEIRMQATPAIKGDLEQMASEQKSFDEMVKYVASRGVQYRVLEAVRPAEQIPMNLLPSLAKLGDKETGFFDNKDSYSLVHIRSSKKVPITEAKAQPVIESFLITQKKQKVVGEEVKRIRTASKVEYLGSFAEAKANPAP
jgi:EpsD family peptidyl-prolyl cis-trans isomerase